jgi:large subunit ribosomal protein L22
MAAPTAVKDRPHTQAQVRYVRMSASKARQVLDLIRGRSVAAADDVLALSERDAALVIQKCLRSAVANAEHNDGLDPEELFVATCFADEGPTLRRFRPRARGRATRIRKRTCHITVVVARYDADELSARHERERAKGTSAGRSGGASRRARVAKSRGEEITEETDEAPVTAEVAEVAEDDAVTADVAEDTPEATDEAAEDTPEATAEAAEDTPEATAEAAEDTAVETGDAGDEAPVEESSTEMVEAHTKDELLAMAEKAGVEVAKSWTKPQIAEAIAASREDD